MATGRLKGISANVQPRKWHAHGKNRTKNYWSQKRISIIFAHTLQDVQARIRGQEVDNGPQKQWHLCVNEDCHLWSEKMGGRTQHQWFCGLRGLVLPFYGQTQTKHCIRTRISQRMPAEYEAKILEFQKFVIGARKKTCFELSKIGNTDEALSL
jgi:hypothetical protein